VKKEKNLKVKTMEEQGLETVLEHTKENGRVIDPEKNQYVKTFIPGLPKSAEPLMAESVTDEDVVQKRDEIRKTQRAEAFKALRQQVEYMRQTGHDLKQAFRPENMREQYTPIEKTVLYVLEHVSPETAKSYRVRADGRVCDLYRERLIEETDKIVKQAEVELNNCRDQYRQNTVGISQKKRQILRTGDQLKKLMRGQQNVIDRLTALPNELYEANEHGDNSLIEKLENEQAELEEAIDVVEMKKGEVANDVYMLHSQIANHADQSQRLYKEKNAIAFILRDAQSKKSKFDTIIADRKRSLSPNDMERMINHLVDTDRAVAALSEFESKYRTVLDGVPTVGAYVPQTYGGLDATGQRDKQHQEIAQTCNDALSIVESYRTAARPQKPSANV